MGSRRVKWSKKALKAFYDQSLIQYCSFPSHPKCRIYYWYNEEVLHITGLRFMLMG